MQRPHDRFFKDTFGDPKHAAPLLRSALPRAIARGIDWRSLQVADKEYRDTLLRERSCDQLFTARVRRRLAFLWLLVEHRSRAKRFTALQVLGYVVAILQHWLERHTRARSLPVILPIVVHHGKRPFSAPVELLDLMDLTPFGPRGRKAIIRYLPRLRLLLDDLAAQSERTIRRRPLTLLGKTGALVMRFMPGRSKQEVEVAIARLRDVLRAAMRGLPRRTYSRILSYVQMTADLTAVELGRTLEREVGPDARETLMNTYERSLRKARREGLAKGKDLGRTEGRTEGRAELLLRQISARFGPPPAKVAARIRAAGTADLDRWAERILTAQTLDDVFA